METEQPEEKPKKKKFAKEKAGSFVDEVFFVISIAFAGFLTFFLYHNNYFHPVGWYFYADVILVGIVFTLFIYVVLQAAKVFVVISMVLCFIYFIAYYALDLRQKFNEGSPNESSSKMEEVNNHFTEVVTNIIYPKRNDSILLRVY